MNHFTSVWKKLNLIFPLLKCCPWEVHDSMHLAPLYFLHNSVVAVDFVQVARPILERGGLNLILFFILSTFPPNIGSGFTPNCQECKQSPCSANIVYFTRLGLYNICRAYIGNSVYFKQNICNVSSANIVYFTRLGL